MDTLRLVSPTRECFHIRQGWLQDPTFMAYNAGWELPTPFYDNDTGCIDWPEQQWDTFEEQLRRPRSEFGYFYVSEGQSPIGHAYYELDQDMRAHIGLNIHPTKRGRGLAKEVLQLLIAAVWEGTDAIELVNEFDDSRTPAVACHRRMGFIPDDQPMTGRSRPTRMWHLPRPE